MQEAGEQLDRKRPLMRNLASHEQVQVPDELDRVGEHVVLQVAQALEVFLLKEVIQALRQHHCEHVLNVEVFRVQKAEFVEQLEVGLVRCSFVRDVV